MYGEQHLLTYKSEKEFSIITFGRLSLSMRQTAWWMAGSFISFNLAKYVPPIPYLDWKGYTLHFIPLVACIVFSFIVHPKTGLNIGTYFKSWLAFKRRKKVYF